MHGARSGLIEVVTLLAPRDPEKWKTYLPLIELQRRTCEKFGHKHVVITDTDLPGFNTFKAEMPENLMRAILTGQLEYMKAWPGGYPVVLVDVDCLIARNLKAAFTGRFDVALTNRYGNPVAPINNGAMYFAGAKAVAVRFLTRALELCKDHWGGDQEAIAQAVAPVPEGPGRCFRFGGRFQFLSMLTHNCVPKQEGVAHMSGPFVVHFKGDRKHWMKTYAESFIL